VYWTALAGICLLAFTAFLDFTIVNTALPFIQKAFQTSILKLQWVANIFPIILSMTMIPIGKIADFLGKKKVFYSGVFLFGCAAILAGLSPTIEILIFWRGVQALGASVVFVASNALIAELFSGKEKMRAISIFGGVTGAGLMLGPFFGGLLVGALDWRWVFWINIPLIFIGMICALCSLRGKVAKPVGPFEIDRKGLGLLIFGLGFLMYGVIAGAQDGFSSVILLLIVLGILFLSLLIYIDIQTTHPLLNLAVFKDPLLLLSVISCAIAGVVSYVFMFFDPLLLDQVLHFSAYTIGWMIGIIPAAQVLISFSFQLILKWINLATLLLLSAMAPLLAALLHLFITPQSSYLFLALPFAFLGINWGLSNTAMIAAVNQNTAPSKIGEAIGTITTMWNLTGAILLAISTALFHLQKAPFLPSFRAVIIFILIFLLLLILLSLLIRIKLSKTQRRH
jgi:MFS family permease